MFGVFPLASKAFADEIPRTAASASVTGFGTTAYLGTISLIFVTPLPVTGLDLTAAVGQITESHTANLSVTGLQLTTTLNSVLPPGSQVAYPVGLLATTALGLLPVGWTDVNDSQTAVWSNVI